MAKGCRRRTPYIAVIEKRSIARVCECGRAAREDDKNWLIACDGDTDDRHTGKRDGELISGGGGGGADGGGTRSRSSHHHESARRPLTGLIGEPIASARLRESSHVIAMFLSAYARALASGQCRQAARV